MADVVTGVIIILAVWADILRRRTRSIAALSGGLRSCSLQFDNDQRRQRHVQENRLVRRGRARPRHWPWPAARALSSNRTSR
jgi:hypothetical protein